ncbi:hypothetical protein OF83DRAFT_1086590 [Amylostereum chailletii]|nr:hypothetical protein OF83DRAFT_1086590 [Amylostereum chailletii]
MPVLDAFKLKEFDLEPVLAGWSDPPRFHGKPKKDPPVDVWLESIKAGCLERKVPKDYWHKVGQRFLGSRARTRFDELKAVLRNMHGGKYRWDWKRFKVAMRNMGWEIDDHKTESFKVQSKPSGIWWIVTGKERQEAPAAELVKGPDEKTKTEKARGANAKGKPEKQKSVDSAPSGKTRKSSVDALSKPLPERPEKSGDAATTTTRGVPKRMASWLSRTPSTSSTASAASTPPVSETAVASASSFWGFGSNTTTPSSTPASMSVAPTPAQSPGEVTTTVTNAPVWLLNACNALDFLTTEHPKAMTTLSAVLITIGSLPAIPAISAGAGGALLASHAVQAAGAIAVGVGNWLRASQDSAAARAANSGSQTPPAEGAKK